MTLGVRRRGKVEPRRWALLAGLLRSAVNRPIVLIPIFSLGGLIAIAQFFFLGRAEGLPLLDDHHDDIGLAHGRELVAVLVVTLPRELSVRATETHLLTKHLFIMIYTTQVFEGLSFGGKIRTRGKRHTPCTGMQRKDEASKNWGIL